VADDVRALEQGRLRRPGDHALGDVADRALVRHDDGLRQPAGAVHTVWYLLSSFQPYGNQLMSFNIAIETPPPTPLATVLGGSYGLAADGTNVYWTDQGDSNLTGLVQQIPATGGTPTVLASPVAVPVVLAIDATNVYWTTGFDGFATGAQAIFTTPKGGGPVTQVLSYDNSDFATSLAVDDQNLYWGGLNGGIFQAPKGTGSPVTTLAPTTDEPLGVIVLGGYVYWTNGLSPGAGSILSTAVGGGQPVMTVASGLDFSGYGGASFYGLATDGLFLYWVESDPTGSGRVATTSVSSIGGPGQTLATTLTGTFASAVAVDANNVYWTNQGGPAAVMAVSKSGGAVTNLAGGAGGLTIAVDSTSVYYTVSGDTVAPASGAVIKIAKP
jgi:hypothetical protein